MDSGRNRKPRPFLKWAGGKGQLVEQLVALAPREFGAYHEPFIGGGAVFFALYRGGRLASREVHLSDVNGELIGTYQAVRTDLQAVCSQLRRYKYPDHYYRVRAMDPEKLVPASRAARMIFLNRTGFNGLYRVNRQGKFNVPLGRYKNPRICDSENLTAVSLAIQGVRLREEPFENVLAWARKGDFVYFDPPYVPVSSTAKFVGYARGGFRLEDQEKLARVFAKLAKRGVRVMLSNSDTSWVRDRYGSFKLVEVKAHRSVNSRSDRRGPVGELVVLSYEPGEKAH